MYRPKIILLVSLPNWALDHCARSMAKRLCHRFDFEIKYSTLGETLDAKQTDLIHIFDWGDKHYKRFGFQKEQIIKSVSSSRWMYEASYNNLSTDEFVSNYLTDCSVVVTPSLSICKILEGRVRDLFHLPNSVETDLFRPPKNKRYSKDLTIGWVGNPDDSYKGLFDILIPAAANYNFLSSNGRLPLRQLLKLYKKIDVLAIASVAEGEPIPLLEGMAAGCFPVATNVGLVPEIIVDGSNGLIVKRDVESFRKAFDWCAQNLTMVRSIGTKNRSIIKDRSWDQCVYRFEEVYQYAYEKKVSKITNKPGIVFHFHSGTNVSGDDIGDNKHSLSQMILPLRFICFDAWSRFWLGDPYRAGFLIRAKTVLVGSNPGEIRAQAKALEKSAPPVTLVAETDGYNLIQAGERFVAVAKSLGPVSLFDERLGERELGSLILVGSNLEEVRVRAQGLQTN